jgi:hypothetical protein
MIKLIDLLNEITSREKFLKRNLEIDNLTTLKQNAFTALGKKYGWNDDVLEAFLKKYSNIYKQDVKNLGYNEYDSFSYYAENHSSNFKEFTPDLYNDYIKIKSRYDKHMTDIRNKFGHDTKYKFGDQDVKYVYHYTTISNAKQILKSNSIKGNAKKLGNSYISVTTDKDLLQNFNINFSGEDGKKSNNKLLACFKIDFQQIKNDNFEMDYTPIGAAYGEQEIEILNKDIKPLNKYVVALILNTDDSSVIENMKVLTQNRGIKLIPIQRSTSKKF